MTTATTPAPEAADPDIGTVPTDVTARNLFPVLREYAAKLADVSQRIYEWQSADLKHYPGTGALVEAGRLICLHEMYRRRVLPIISTASGLLDHAKLDGQVEDELALRWDETQEQLRFADVAVAKFVDCLERELLAIDEVRKLIEKSGRYKSPV